MKTRETQTEPKAAPKAAPKPALPNPRRQLRTFALAWTGLTLFFGACTFISIYAATGTAANSASISGKGIPPASISQNTTPTLVAPPSDSGTGQANVPTLVPTDQGSLATPTGVVSLVPSLIPPTNQAANTPSNNAQPNGQAVAQSNTQVPPTASSVPATQAPKATATVPPPPTATIPAINDTAFDLGIAVQDNNDPNTYKNWVNMVSSQLKLNWVKAQVSWRDVEKAKGQIDWTAMDVEIKMMNAANVKVMLSITHAPDWARDPGAPTDQPGHLDGPPHDPQDLANFITAILKRYPGMIQAIEVWNEINLDREWSVAPQQLDPRRYVTLLQTDQSYRSQYHRHFGSPVANGR